MRNRILDRYDERKAFTDKIMVKQAQGMSPGTGSVVVTFVSPRSMQQAIERIEEMLSGNWPPYQLSEGWNGTVIDFVTGIGNDRDTVNNIIDGLRKLRFKFDVETFPGNGTPDMPENTVDERSMTLANKKEARKATVDKNPNLQAEIKKIAKSIFEDVPEEEWVEELNSDSTQKELEKLADKYNVQAKDVRKEFLRVF